MIFGTGKYKNTSPSGVINWEEIIHPKRTKKYINWVDNYLTDLTNHFKVKPVLQGDKVSQFIN